MGRLGFFEILLIMFVLILVFGAAKLPLLARGMGESIKEFKKAIKDEDREQRNG